MRLYLRDIASELVTAPAASATEDEDEGHAGDARLVCLTSSRSKGAAAVPADAVCAAHPGGALDMLRIFLSPALAGQTLEAGEQFTLAGSFDSCFGEGQGGGEYEEVYLRVFAYLWRPGLGYVCSLFGNGTSRSGINDPNPQWVEPFGPTWQIVALPVLTADVEVSLRDRIVVEVWFERTVTTTTQARFAFNGTKDDYADGENTQGTSAGSYIAFSTDLAFAPLGIDPDNLLVGARELLVDGLNVGAVVGGTRLEILEQAVEQQPDMQISPERVDVIGRRLVLVCQMEEPTIENLCLAWGLPAEAVEIDGDAVRLAVGAQTERRAHEVVVRGNAPGEDYTRTIRLRRATIIAPSGHFYSRQDATTFAVRFLALAEPGAAEQIFVEVWDEPGRFEFELRG